MTLSIPTEGRSRRRDRRLAGALTPRDEEILRFLFESKVATQRQVHERFFPQVSRRMSYRRISQLARAGWITRHGYFNGRASQFIHSLSEQGYRTYVYEEGVSDERKQLMSDVIEHDLALVDLRLKFEQATWTTRFHTENALQSDSNYTESDEFRDFVRLRSDAVLELLIKEKHRLVVPVEYEASFKSKERCREKLLRYYVQSDPSAVFWICKSEAVRKRVLKVDQALAKDRPPKMYAALLSEALSPGAAILLQNAEGRKIVMELARPGVQDRVLTA